MLCCEQKTQEKKKFWGFSFEAFVFLSTMPLVPDKSTAKSKQSRKRYTLRCSLKESLCYGSARRQQALWRLRLFHNATWKPSSELTLIPPWLRKKKTMPEQNLVSWDKIVLDFCCFSSRPSKTRNTWSKQEWAVTKSSVHSWHHLSVIFFDVFSPRHPEHHITTLGIGANHNGKSALTYQCALLGKRIKPQPHGKLPKVCSWPSSCKYSPSPIPQNAIPPSARRETSTRPPRAMPKKWAPLSKPAQSFFGFVSNNQ